MPLSILFHAESDPVAIDDVTSHQLFSCPRWQSSNFDVMPEAAKQRFAILYHRPIFESNALVLGPYRILSCDDWPDDSVVNHYKLKSDHAKTSSPWGAGVTTYLSIQEVRYLCVKVVARCPVANKGRMVHALSPLFTRNFTCPMSVFPITDTNKNLNF